MTVTELRAAVERRGVQKVINKLAEDFACQVAGEVHADPPVGWFTSVEDLVTDAIEDTLLGLDVPSPAEWEAEVDDDAADHEFQRSAGL